MRYIKYKLKGKKCLTPCADGQRFGTNNPQAKVGSIWCKRRCDHNVETDLETQTVSCRLGSSADIIGEEDFL